MELVKIHWVDSRGAQAEWQHLEGKKNSICEIMSVGFVLERTLEFIHIAPHLADDQSCGDMTIPMVCITQEILTLES